MVKGAKLYLQFLVLVLCILYGSVFVLGKLTLEYAPPLFITGARMMLAGVLLLIHQFIFYRCHFTLKKKHLAPILIIGIGGVYLTNALEFWGLQYIEAGRACFLYSFSPIATALMSYAWFSEKLSLQKWIGILIGVLGFIPLWMGPTSIEDTSGKFLFLTLAELSVLIAAMVSSIGWLAMRELVKNREYSSAMANGTSMIVGGLFAFIHSWLVEPWDPTPVQAPWPFLYWFLSLTLISNLICYNLHAKLLRSFTATYLSFVGLSQPFFSALLGWMFLNEILSVYFWVSFIAVSLGLYVYYQEELKQKVSSTIIES